GAFAVRVGGPHRTCLPLARAPPPPPRPIEGAGVRVRALPLMGEGLGGGDDRDAIWSETALAASRFLGCTSRVLRLFPIAPIKEMARFQHLGIDAVETACIDADLIGIRARHVKGVHPALPAEGM